MTFIFEKVKKVARSNLRMTLDDVCRAFWAMGIPVEKGRLADDIAAGVYPFGKISRHLTEKTVAEDRCWCEVHFVIAIFVVKYLDRRGTL